MPSADWFKPGDPDRGPDTAARAFAARRHATAAKLQDADPRELWPPLRCCLDTARRQGTRSMTRSCGWTGGRSALLTLAVLCLLAAPGRSQAQDAGVSGIPPGPGNVRGLNGSVNDPSGIGNATRVPALPSPTITPVTPPGVSSTGGGYRPAPMQRAVKLRRPRYAALRYRRGAHRAAVTDQAAVREYDKLIDRKVLSICRGC